MELHIAPVKTKLEPGPAGFWVGLVQLWFCSTDPIPCTLATARNNHFPVLGASARENSSESKTCQGDLWGSVSLASHST